MKNENICDLFLDQYEALKTYSFKICKQMEIAEDVTQDVFLSLYTKYNENDSSIENKLSFLFQAIRFASFSALKKNKKICSLKENEIAVDPLNNDFLAEEIILKAIDEIPSQRRKAFHLRRMRHLKVKEIAKIMDIKPKTVENHITLVLHTLKERLLPIS